MPAPTKSNAAMSPDGGSAQPAVPKTELQELQLKAGEVTDEVSNVLYSFNICGILCMYNWLSSLFIRVYVLKYINFLLLLFMHSVTWKYKKDVGSMWRSKILYILLI